MTKLFYGSETGTTEEVANLIAERLECPVEILEASAATREDFQESSRMILGTSTWGEGELPGDWEGVQPVLESCDFSGKTVAIFGLGDQEGYPDNFVDGMGILYEIVTERGARVVGFTSVDGYDYDESRAEIRPGYFCGLALDEDNQSDLTRGRIDRWVEEISKDICEKKE